MKKIVTMGLSFMAVLLVIPMSFQAIYRAQGSTMLDNEEQLVPVSQEEMMVTVFRDALDEHQELLLEEYLIGVVAAEMPAQFELEALKAQAITARTYTLRILETSPYILDTVQHQVFKDEGQLRERWGDDFDYYYTRIRQAVQETKGLVITHDGDLIKPLFFAISNGKTENSEDYFTSRLPYMRAVNSEWDKSATGFEREESFSLTEIRNIFEDNTLTINSFEILSRTEGGNVREVRVGDNTYTGREFREKLELRSSDFEFAYEDNTIYVTTFGYGHGVGMSQTGANELARMGKTYEDILHHYYQNIKIIEKTSLS